MWISHDFLHSWIPFREASPDPPKGNGSTTHLIITQHNFTSLLQSFEIQVIYFICYRKALEKAYGPLHASMTDKQVYSLRKLERKLFNAWCRSAICLSIYLSIYLTLKSKIQNLINPSLFLTLKIFLLLKMTIFFFFFLWKTARNLSIYLSNIGLIEVNLYSSFSFKSTHLI